MNGATVTGSKARHHGRRDERGADGDDRHLDRQRRAQRHPRQLRHADRSDRLGLDRLHDGEHRRHPDDRLVPAPLRLPPLLRGLDRCCSPPPARCAAWPGTCRRSCCSASCRAWAAARSSRPRRRILFARYPQAGARHGRGAVRPRRDHRPAARPDDRRLPDRRGRAGTGSSCQRAARHRSPRPRVWRVIEEPGFAPPKAPRSTSSGIALLAVGMASLQYVLEEGNREGWFDSAHDHRARRGRGDLARHLHRARARDAAPGRRSARVQEPQLRGGHRASTSSSASRCSAARTCSRCSAARSCTTARSTSARCSSSRARRRSC